MSAEEMLVLTESDLQEAKFNAAKFRREGEEKFRQADNWQARVTMLQAQVDRMRAQEAKRQHNA